MVWRAIFYRDLNRLESKIEKNDAEYYTTVLEKSLLPTTYEAMRDSRIVHQNNFPIHTAKYTLSSLQDNDLQVLDRPAWFSDLNIVENFWYYMVCGVYKN